MASAFFIQIPLKGESLRPDIITSPLLSLWLLFILNVLSRGWSWYSSRPGCYVAWGNGWLMNHFFSFVHWGLDAFWVFCFYFPAQRSLWYNVLAVASDISPVVISFHNVGLWSEGVSNYHPFLARGVWASNPHYGSRFKWSQFSCSVFLIVCVLLLSLLVFIPNPNEFEVWPLGRSFRCIGILVLNLLAISSLLGE